MNICLFMLTLIPKNLCIKYKNISKTSHSFFTPLSQTKIYTLPILQTNNAIKTMFFFLKPLANCLLSVGALDCDSETNQTRASWLCEMMVLYTLISYSWKQHNIVSAFWLPFAGWIWWLYFIMSMDAMFQYANLLDVE